MTTMEGGCFCGTLRYRVGGDFGVTHSHCIHCRKIPRYGGGRRDSLQGE